MDIAIMAKKQYEHHKYSTMKNPTEYQRGLMKTRCMSEEDLQKRTELDKRWIREYFAPLNDFQPGSNGYSVAKESIRYAVNSAKFFGSDDARANVIESLFKTCQDVELWKIVIACHNLAKTSSVTPTGEMLLDIFNSLT